MGFLKFVGSTILKIRGWKTTGEMPEEIKKCVIVVAPHTSLDDFIIGRCFYWTKETPVKFLMKIEAFSNPVFSWLLKQMGAIPVNRGHRNNMVNMMIELFNKEERLNLVITPEGTRKMVKKWKKGFYHIALGAQVPIVLGFMDFEKKLAGYGPVIYPSGDYDEDLKTMQEFFMNIKAKHPEKFNLDEQYRQQEAS